jgi:heptosyltransferase-2
MSSTRRILVVGPSWVGDMVMAQSLFMTLQTRHPGAQIDVLAPQWSLPILERMPQVRRGIAMPLGHGQFGLRTRWQLGRELAREGYDQAIVLPGSLKSALVPWFAGIQKRTGFTGEMRYGLLNDRRDLDKTVLPMTVQRFVALGLPPASGQTPPCPTPRLAANAANSARLPGKLGLSTHRPVIAFMPGAEYGPAKQWPAPHFAQLAKDLIVQGHQIWILGSAKDHDIAEQIALAAASTHIHNLCGKTQLADVVDLLSICNAAVSNDSGLMHVAAALGIPLVALYGSSDPKHTPPLSPNAHVLYLGLECSPCFKRQCPLGHTRCLQEITPDLVLKALA